MRVLLPLLLAPLVLSGCDPEIPTALRPAVIQPVFDPSRADLPVPNDLAMVNGRVAIAPRDDFSAAEK